MRSEATALLTGQGHVHDKLEDLALAEAMKPNWVRAQCHDLKTKVVPIIWIEEG